MLSFSSKIALRLIKKIEYGELKITSPDNKTITIYGSKDPNKIKADLFIINWKSLSMSFLKGDIGFGESYIQGYWSSSNLFKLFLLIIYNKNRLKKLINGKKIFLLSSLFNHWLNYNSKKNSKLNIESHYDLGNDFYKLWLDKTMTYSSALFLGNHSDLESAQLNKIERVIKELNSIPKNASICEIGFGWGGVASHIVKKTNWNYYGITLSKKQLDYTKNKFATDIEKGNCNFFLKDYRELKEKFDGIISIEMFEAVGELYWDKFFNIIYQSLKSEGKAIIQTILINEEKYEIYKNQVDFIQTYIFPGGMLASASVFKNLIKKNNFELIDEFFFGQDYEKTLKIWSKNFSSYSKEITDYGLSDNFQRMWKFYLEYCRAGFKTEEIQVAQYAIKKKNNS